MREDALDGYDQRIVQIRDGVFDEFFVEVYLVHRESGHKLNLLVWVAVL